MTTLRSRSILSVLILIAALVGGTALTANAVSTNCHSVSGMRLVEYRIPTRNGQPGAISTAPDGTIWFTEPQASRIGRIDRAGLVREYKLATYLAGLRDIKVAPDGTVWFTEFLANKVGKLTRDGKITEYWIGPAYSITVGPDHNLWIGMALNEIVRMRPNGQVISRYQLPIHSDPIDGIVVGPDRALWFTNWGLDMVERITLSGRVTEYSMPPGPMGSGPRGIPSARITTCGSP